MHSHCGFFVTWLVSITAASLRFPSRDDTEVLAPGAGKGFVDNRQFGLSQSDVRKALASDVAR
jgi:hypothetical protein